VYTLGAQAGSAVILDCVDGSRPGGWSGRPSVPNSSASGRNRRRLYLIESCAAVTRSRELRTACLLTSLTARSAMRRHFSAFSQLTCGCYVTMSVNQTRSSAARSSNVSTFASLQSIARCRHSIVSRRLLSATDAQYWYNNSVRPSVCPSAPSVRYVPVFYENGLTCCHKFFTVRYSPIILLYEYQTYSQNSDGNHGIVALSATRQAYGFSGRRP